MLSAQRGYRKLSATLHILNILSFETISMNSSIIRENLLAVVVCFLNNHKWFNWKKYFQQYVTVLCKSACQTISIRIAYLFSHLIKFLTFVVFHFFFQVIKFHSLCIGPNTLRFTLHKVKCRGRYMKIKWWVTYTEISLSFNDILIFLNQ